MTLTKKEKTLILVLLVMVYAFAFVKIVILNSMPKVKDAQTRLSEIKSQKAALDLEYLNIENYKAETKAKEVVNERLGDYLMENAGLSDSIVFVEDLALLLGTELKSISLSQPQELTTGSVKYYGFPVRFDVEFSYDQFQEIIRFCEGASQKVSISDFKLSALNAQADIYKISLELVFYSINKESADKLYEFSRKKFMEYKDKEGLPIYIASDAAMPKDILQKDGKQTSSGAITKTNADFIVFHRGYLYAGYNFETYSGLNPAERTRLSTRGKVDVFLTLDGSEYTLESIDSDGNRETFKGILPDRYLTFYIESNVYTDIPENNDLQVNITIKNDSGRNIRVKTAESGGRMKLMDRDGNEIDIKSDKEKVYF